ncbi:hypothetical protein [Salinibacterium sp. M195]|uniref:hypothetical protein n=1 Tax=Salinibacterium sp. M195 TaxID=2583374 RepID=UPI00351CD0DA
MTLPRKIKVLNPLNIVAPSCGGYVNYDAFAADGEADDEVEELEDPEVDEPVVEAAAGVESDFLDSDDELEELPEEPDVLEPDSLELVVARESLR